MLFGNKFLLLLWLSVEVAYALVPPHGALPVPARQRIHARSVTATTTNTVAATATATHAGINHKSACKARKSSSSGFKSSSKSATKTHTAPQCYNSADPDSGSGDWCVCSYSSDYISFTPKASQTCPETIPASILSSLSATSTSATGPITVTAKPTGYYPYTKWDLNGAVTACEGSSVGEVAGYSVTYCSGSTSMVSTAIAYSTHINVSPNNIINYGNWSDFESSDWDKDTDASRTSKLFSAFSTALSTLCHDSASSTVLSVTATSFDFAAETMSLIPTTTTMYMCADATKTAEKVRFIEGDQSDNADLTVTVPFSHYDMADLDKWINLTSFALVGNAMQTGNTFLAKYMIFEEHGSIQNKIVEHKGPSGIDLSYFSSLDTNMVLQQFQVQVGFKLEESEFDCALMQIAEAFTIAVDLFFPELSADLIPEESTLETLCDLASG
ncbi:hypothetical protein N7495_008450 [Penicillium taxi]|uniref:uncharacterized protein n=1 Tax=Penicillium taxi TaxID=168475 RepID=UPI00254503E6|nr:uncharacterized protein N7495_008450 [Penicillium taxi]KAJ5888409.1 hypothetical protein N7495_008450 [Penicillium taxi]